MIFHDAAPTGPESCTIVPAVLNTWKRYESAPGNVAPNFTEAADTTSVAASVCCASLSGDDSVGADTFNVEPSAAAAALAAAAPVGDVGVDDWRLHAMASASSAAMPVTVNLLDIRNSCRDASEKGRVGLRCRT